MALSRSAFGYVAHWRCRYMVALILGFASSALGCLAARIAGDDWPE